MSKGDGKSGSALMYDPLHNTPSNLRVNILPWMASDSNMNKVRRCKWLMSGFIKKSTLLYLHTPGTWVHCDICYTNECAILYLILIIALIAHVSVFGAGGGHDYDALEA